MFAVDFINFSVRFAEKMISEGYETKTVVKKIKNYGKHWTATMGAWPRILRIILWKLRKLPID